MWCAQNKKMVPEHKECRAFVIVKRWVREKAATWKQNALVVFSADISQNVIL